MKKDAHPVDVGQRGIGGRRGDESGRDGEAGRDSEGRRDLYITSNLLTLVVFVNTMMKTIVRKHLALSRTHYRILVFLERNGGSAYVSDLVAWLRLAAPTVTEAVKGLQGRGLVQRNRDGRDRRKVALTLTRSGTDLLRQADLLLARFVNKLWEPLSQEHKDVIIEGTIQIDGRFKTALPRDGARLISMYLEVFYLTYDVFEMTVRQLGLSVNEFRVLFELDQRPGPVSMKDLSHTLVMRPNELTVVIDGLAERSLVTRRDSEVDLRSVVVTLTEAGGRALAVCLEPVDTCFAQGTYSTDEAHRDIYIDEADLIVPGIADGSWRVTPADGGCGPRLAPGGVGSRGPM